MKEQSRRKRTGHGINDRAYERLNKTFKRVAVKFILAIQIKIL
jgi:hypothetical protein